MNRCTPEQAGVPSAAIAQFIRTLNHRHLSTHAILLARADNIFAECYYKPFDEHFKHRMYSVSKSFVSIAVGFCEQDGLLSLDDPMVKYFPDYVASLPEEQIPTTTIREMLRMRTSKDSEVYWFYTGTKDRTEVYFRPTTDKYPDTVFRYDSPGTYMLGVIVERLTGKPFLKYLQEKVLDDIGFSRDAYCLKAPGGHSWGDSAILCTARDLLLFARFVLNRGTWEGRRYLNERYINEAMTTDGATDIYGFDYFDSHGYGYQFWGAPHGCVCMLGMGNQIALMDQKHDLIFVINSDNQGNPHGYEIISQAFFNILYPAIGDPLPADPQAKALLDALCAAQQLYFVDGPTDSTFRTSVQGQRFVCRDNPMGWRWFELSFDGDEGVVRFENATGEKELTFGLGKNVFSMFPEEGYADDTGTIPCPGRRYACAASADWLEKRKLRLRVQIIDTYLGNLAIVFGFRDDRHVTIRMDKTAEAFLDEYCGCAMAQRID